MGSFGAHQVFFLASMAVSYHAVLGIIYSSISQATVGCSRWQARPMVEAIRKPGNHASGLAGVSKMTPICPFTSRLRLVS